MQYTTQINIKSRGGGIISEDLSSQKAAARIWFLFLTSVWPPVNTEEYWTATAEKASKIWNENPDNLLLRKLLTMTYEYLGENVR